METEDAPDTDSAFGDAVLDKQERNVPTSLIFNGESDDNDQDNCNCEIDENGKPLPRRSSLLKNANNRRPQGRKKTVSFTSMPKERKITTGQDCLIYMQAGSDLIKVRSNSRQYHRMFQLNSDMTEIRWHPTSKKPHKARIAISSVKEVHHGKTTDALKNKEIAGCYPDECAFSIIFGENYDTMDLIASMPDEANIWVTGLTCLLNSNFKCRTPDSTDDMDHMRDSWLLEMFRSADSENEGILDEFEVVSLVKRLNNKLASGKIVQKLKEIEHMKCTSTTTRHRINSDEFITLFKDLSTRPEIYFLLVRYASNADYMTVDDLLIFLEAEQGKQRASRDECVEIIDRYEPSAEGKLKAQLGIDGFTSYLLSDECEIFDPDHLHVCQDMTQPLCHYFIATSHNTYLMEDQLKGPSSVNGYIRALRKGCRCVELDCWDGPDDEPVIYHGRTLTSKISFRSVVETINEHAFVNSQHPVILAMENHCSLKQQKVMADCLKQVFGEKLFRSHVIDDTASLPSPDDFKNKILIKGKKFCQGKDESEEGDVTDEDEGLETDRKRHKREGSLRKHRLNIDMSDLVNYLVSTRFESFAKSQQSQKTCELCSLSESQALKHAISCAEDFVNHNKVFISRIYPTGMRVDSSNYNPQDLWNCGCQLVALNYQTPGLMMDLYDGWFHKNGNCGYVLKPAVMRDEIAYFSANTRDVIPGVSPQLLHIKIISGQHFPKPRGSGAKGDVTDPYVTIDIFGIPADCAEERTKTVAHNGYNPIFDESFEFQISLPEMALVRFAVLDDDYIGDEFIGQYTIPFECMLTGYRHIRLLNNTGEQMENCTLFVHVAITNKRGGGKIPRRGSAKKNSKQHEYARLKTIGVKSIDETFKVATQPLSEASDLRDTLHSSLLVLKEACGLSPISNLKQCVRLLATRIANNADDVVVTVTEKSQIPQLMVTGNPPDILRKALVALEDVLHACREMAANCDTVHTKLWECQLAGLEWHEELETLCQQFGLKGRKIVKATENFAWNIRVLKGQTDLLQQSKKESEDYTRQIHEACVSTGLCKDN